MLELIKTSRAAFRGVPDAKAEYDILTLLVGELETSSKRDNSQITDEKVIAAIKKLIKSNNETLKLMEGESDLELKLPKALSLKAQNAYLKHFLPEEMSEEQIRSELQWSHSTIPFTSIGEAIKFLNGKHPGKFDKSLASKVAKELF